VSPLLVGVGVVRMCAEPAGRLVVPGFASRLFGLSPEQVRLRPRSALAAAAFFLGKRGFPSPRWERADAWPTLSLGSGLSLTRSTGRQATGGSAGARPGGRSSRRAAERRVPAVDPRDLVEEDGVVMGGPGGAPQEGETPGERRERDRGQTAEPSG
jgi:hypothetical protein